MVGMTTALQWAPAAIAVVAFIVALTKGAHWAGGVTTALQELRRDVTDLANDHEEVEAKLVELQAGQARMEASLDHLHKCVHRLDTRLNQIEAGRGQVGFGEAGLGMASRAWNEEVPNED